MITVITPTVRPELLRVVGKCLSRQGIDHEWLVVAPERLREEMESELTNYPHRFIAEPEKLPDDYYALCKAWNKGFALAKGGLVVTVQDGIWFPPDMLERFYSHYRANPKACITVIGHHYEDYDENFKPTGLVWSDPRARADLGTFYEVSPTEMEMAVCSVPKQAAMDCGGIDEEYDKGAAVGEKEMCWRLDRLGYKFYIDQSIEYRAIHHPRLNEKWDEAYKVSSALYSKHMGELVERKRVLNVDCLNKYL
jgi:hypothetical protein